jgi:soluble lytic murein transglycosylase
LIKKYCVEYNLKPELICSIIHTESKFDQYAVSRRGASGLMQIRKSTADWGAREIGIHNYDYTRIFEANINIQIGCWYIDKLFKQFKNYDLAICAYNAGSGNVSKWIRQMKDANASEIDIPFKETRNYIKRVRKNENIYKVIIHILKK